MTPDGKTFDPETVTDKQLVQHEQAIDRGLTEADAIRLTEHEYNGFQANAIIAAALNPAVGEDVLDALATPKYTAAQMTAIAKIAIRGGDFARFLDPQMDARRMEAAYLVVAHGGSDLPVEHLSRSQLLTINNILLQGHIPYETVRAIAKPAFTPESMEVIAAAMENARHDPYTGEHSLTEAQVARIMNPEYRPEQQIALLTAMRGQTPVADLSDADFAGLFPASLSVEQMSACAYAVNRCGYNTPLLMMTMQACADMNAQQLMAIFDATAAEFSDATMAKVSTILMHTPALTSQQMRYLLAEARDGTPFPALESMKEHLLAQVEPEKALVAETGVKSESRDMASGKEALAEQTGLDNTPWQQALGELLLRLRVEKDDYQWIQCPNSESAVNMMNMVMDAHMPKDFFDDFVCGDEEYGLNEEAHEMASGRKEIDSQTKTKDAPEVDADKEVK